MEHHEPVCIASRVEERFLDTYSIHKQNEKFQDLEQKCWDAGKFKKQTFTGRQRSLSGNLKYHYIQRRPRKTSWTESLKDQNKLKTVNGIDTNDIPTIYNIAGFKSHELIVIGTYIDRNIIPGFRYKVRKNFSNNYIFDGQAQILESVGLGFGKRLTFKNTKLTKNKNYLWSDSYDYGFGFTFQSVNPNVVFRIIDTNINKDIGRVTVNNPSLSVDKEIATAAHQNGEILKTAQVHFSGDVTLLNNCLKQNIFYGNMEIRGNAVICRSDVYSEAKITKITLQNFIMEDCILMLEE